MWHAWERGEIVQGFDGKLKRKSTLGRLKRRWEDAVRRDLREIGWGVE
jgi:hypothetical protein